jgi:hypothetical protein
MGVIKMRGEDVNLAHADELTEEIRPLQKKACALQ